MLEIQRWKSYSKRELRNLGLSEQEIHDVNDRKPRTFKPAFINGQRRIQHETEQLSFYERFSKPQKSGELITSAAVS
jgi:hypothetical protein